jgi:agmatinase
VIEMALDAAWKDCDAVYMSYDIDSLDAAFVPGTGWPEPGGLLPREAHKLVGGVAREGLCGMELVEVSSCTVLITACATADAVVIVAAYSSR